MSTSEGSKENLVFLLEHYSKLWQKNPGSKYFVPLAEVYRSLRLWDDALRTLKQGLKRHPTYYIGRALLAQVYFEKGEYVNASLEAEEVFIHSPTHFLILRILSLSFYKLHNLEKASFYLQKWLAIFPDCEEAQALKKEKTSMNHYKMIPLPQVFNVGNQKKIEFLNTLLLKLQRRHEKVM